MSIARQYAGQKVWPRAVYIRRARYYHSARLRWSAIERRRGALEDVLIDDLAEWSMWHYPSGKDRSNVAYNFRSHSSAFNSLQFEKPARPHSKHCPRYTLETVLSWLPTLTLGLQSFDGVRRRCLPKFYEALEPGTEDDRMKGALWALNVPVFGVLSVRLKRTSSYPHTQQQNTLSPVRQSNSWLFYPDLPCSTEPTLATDLAKHLFGCQHNEKVFRFHSRIL